VHLITIDFETFYAPTFSLSKITTENYIRSPNFETIGVSVKVDDGEATWFSGTDKQIKAFLDQFPWDDAAAMAHNAMFDMAILNWHYDIRPKRIIDTLSMARALGQPSVSLANLARAYKLGEKGVEVANAINKRRLDFTPKELAAYGAYCNNDVELTYALFKAIGEGFPLSEFKLIDLTIRMFTEPTLVLDKQVLVGHLTDVRAKKEELLAATNIDKNHLMSNQQLAFTLMGLGVIPPMKKSEATGRQTYAFSKTDEDFLELLEHPDIRVQAIVAARLGVKSTLEETRTERLIEIADRGPLPIPLRYYAAHTGRWGGDDKVNMQNLPRTSPLKKAICAPAGYVMIDCDSSQIEARTLAWLAGQDDLVDAFDKGEDVYKIMASAIYGKPESEITKDERFVGKTTILGAGYGMGATKFRAQLKTFGVEMSQEECERIISVYRATYPKIPLLWREGAAALQAIMREGDGNTTKLGLDSVLVVDGKKGIRLPNGLYLRYPNLRVETNKEGRDEILYDTSKGRASSPTRIYGGKVIENVCQALARIVIGEQMIALSRKYRPVMTVHDAVAVVVPEKDAAEVLEIVQACMRMRPKWALGLPLNCEGGSGKNYGDCK
jgi:DNA polymerase